MNRRSRICAVALCVIIIVTMLVSAAYIIHEAEHDCTGKDCPVCQAIAFNSRLLRLMAAVLLLPALMSGIPDAGQAQHDGRKAFIPVSGTLVSWKIRLDN